jgi:hypothetical protein
MATVGLSALGGCMTGDESGASPGQLETTQRDIWTSTPNGGWEIVSLDTAVSTPAVAQWGTGKTIADQNIDIFWRASNNHLYHIWWQNNAWWNREDFGDVMASGSQPAAISRTNNIRDVFWRGSNNHLMHKWNQNGWSGAEDLGGTLSSSPAAISWGTTALHVFWKGSNGNLQWKSMDYATNTWTNRSDIVIPAAYKVSSDPAAMYRNNGVADIFWQGPNNRMEHIWSTDAKSWSSVQEFGVSLYSGSSPTATRRANGEVHIFWRGTDNYLKYIWMDAKSNWSAVSDVSGGTKIASSPGATSWGSGRLDVFARDNTSTKMARKVWSQNAKVDVIKQETDNWCWAASGQMIMRFWGKEVSQCQQANDEFGKTTCCTSNTDKNDTNVCNKGGLPYWNHYGFNGTWKTGNQNAALLSEIQGEVAAGRPWEHDIAWTNPTGGGHEMVGVDEFRFNGDDWVVVNNPNGTGQYMETYATYVASTVEGYVSSGDQFVAKCAGFPNCP